MVADQSAISRRSVGERSATDWWSVGDCIFGVCFWLQKVCNFLEIGWQPIGDQSATKNCVGIVCNRCNWSAISRHPVGDQSATCRRPPKTFLRPIWSQIGFTCSNQILLATKSSLQPSATCRRPVTDLLATALQPPCDHPKFWLQGGRKEVADRLQAMCDWGLRQWLGTDQATSHYPKNDGLIAWYIYASHALEEFRYVDTPPKKQYILRIDILKGT